MYQAFLVKVQCKNKWFMAFFIFETNVAHRGAEYGVLELFL